MGEVSEGSLERAFLSFAKTEKKQGKSEKMTDRVGTEKLCPLMSFQGHHVEAHCLDACEWNDGEGCAIWRLIKCLEKSYIIKEQQRIDLLKLKEEVIQKWRNQP